MPDNSTPDSSPPPTNLLSDFSRYLEESGDVLLTVEEALRGRTLVRTQDEHGNPLYGWRSQHTPLLNDEGIGKVLTSLKIVISKNTTISYFTEKEIYSIAIDEIVIPLIVSLFPNYEMYNIFPDDFDLIRGIITTAALASLHRAREGRELDKITQTEQVRKVYDYTQNNEKKKGIFD